MPPKPIRYQNQHCLHFITFSCYHRLPFLNSVEAREIFESELERVRNWYGFYIAGYVVMPEHVHLLISEPELNTLSVVIQMLKQITSHKLKSAGTPHFWQKRYYGFPVWSERKRIEKLRYIHRNPVKRGLVERPEDWRGSSFRQWADGEEGTVEIECAATARRREQIGKTLTLVKSHPVPRTA
jgi:REP-associated tyrosine transposase